MRSGKRDNKGKKTGDYEPGTGIKADHKDNVYNSNLINYFITWFCLFYVLQSSEKSDPAGKHHVSDTVLYRFREFD